jgi:hypothetical protein
MTVPEEAIPRCVHHVTTDSHHPSTIIQQLATDDLLVSLVWVAGDGWVNH